MDAAQELLKDLVAILSEEELIRLGRRALLAGKPVLADFILEQLVSRKEKPWN